MALSRLKKATFLMPRGTYNSGVRIQSSFVSTLARAQMSGFSMVYSSSSKTILALHAQRLCVDSGLIRKSLQSCSTHLKSVDLSGLKREAELHTTGLSRGLGHFDNRVVRVETVGQRYDSSVSRKESWIRAQSICRSSQAVG